MAGKFNPIAAEAALKGARAGLHYREIAALARISEDTLAKWRRGVITKRFKMPDGSVENREVPSKQLSEFSESFVRAEAELQQSLLASIRLAASLREVKVTKTKTLPNGGVIVEERVSHEVDWHAAVALLERRWPDLWKKREGVEVDDPLEAEIRGMLRDLTGREVALVQRSAPDLPPEESVMPIDAPPNDSQE